MSLLDPTVPFMADEAPASFVSRLARQNNIPSVRDFCLDMGLVFQRIVDGCEDTLAKVAGLVGMSALPLLDQAIHRDGKAFAWRGQTMVRSTLRRARLHGCPACLLNDIADGHAPAECAPYGRTIWLLAPIRSCPVHGIALMEIARAGGPHDLHDFALLMQPRIGDLGRLAAGAVPRPSSPLEDYLLGRLDGITGAVPWLDGLAWHAAAKTCEMIGAVALHGRTPNLKKLTDADWHRAGEAGFGIAREGEDGIRTFLSELQRTYPYTRAATEKPQAQFGRIYQWLAFGARHPAYEPVRELIARHIHESTPVGPGDLLFGKPVEPRILHSIRTASLETGAHPKRLRKILAAAGHLPPDHAGRPNHQVFFRPRPRPTR